MFRAKAEDSEEVVAIKSVKLQREREGYPVTSLREITLLRKLKHRNIVRVLEVVTGDAPDQVFVVMEYVKHELKSLLTQGPSFSHSEVKHLFRDLLRALAYLHENWVFHRDLKTSNLLLTEKGTLKLCDFGLARHFSRPLRPYTPVVVTLWYRAPELLLGTSRYSEAIDVWSAGCVFAEMLLSEPLFPGRNELDQLDKIFRSLGPPKDWPEWRAFPLASKVSIPKRHSSLRAKFPSEPYEDQFYLSDLGIDLLSKLLCYDPAKRISAVEALQHPYFEEHPLPARPRSHKAATHSNAHDHQDLLNRKRSLDEVQLKQREELHERTPSPLDRHYAPQ